MLVLQPITLLVPRGRRPVGFRPELCYPGWWICRHFSPPRTAETMDAELTHQDFIVPTLGPATFPSPLGLSTVQGDGLGDFVPDGARVRYHIETELGRPPHPDLMLEKAGPREKIFFEPSRCKAAIVTCGGLCPGLNNVIRSVFLQLYHRYGVPTVLGIRYGYQGLNPAKGPPPLVLTPEYVERIHNQGGTVLRSSRGPEEPAVIVDYLQSEGINLLFCLGGDGTQRGTHAIAMEAQRRGAQIAVVGIPKTIDNDLPFVQRSFGHGTALEKAREAINCAHRSPRRPQRHRAGAAHGPQRRLHCRRRGPGQPGGQLRAHPRGPFSTGRARRLPRRLAEADRGPAACRNRRRRRCRAALVRLRAQRMRRLGQSQAAGHRRRSCATRSRNTSRRPAFRST